MLLVHHLEVCSYQFGNAQIMWYWSINAYTNDAPWLDLLAETKYMAN
jgi:hypothetical protein